MKAKTTLKDNVHIVLREPEIKHESTLTAS